MSPLLSCELLDSGLNFSHDRIHPCCPDSRYKRPEIPFNGGEVPIDLLSLIELDRDVFEEALSSVLALGVVHQR